MVQTNNGNYGGPCVTGTATIAIFVLITDSLQQKSKEFSPRLVSLFMTFL